MPHTDCELSPSWLAYLQLRGKRSKAKEAIAARNEIVESHLSTARRIAKEEAGRLRGLLDYDDCESHAFEGVIKAVESWDPERGPWEQVLDYRVRMQIREGVRTRHGRKGVQKQRLRAVLKKMKLVQHTDQVFEWLRDSEEVGDEVAKALAKLGFDAEQIGVILLLTVPRPKVDYVTDEMLMQLTGEIPHDRIFEQLEVVGNRIKGWWHDGNGDPDYLGSLYQAQDILRKHAVAAQSVKEFPPPLQETLF